MPIILITRNYIVLLVFSITNSQVQYLYTLTTLGGSSKILIITRLYVHLTMPLILMASNYSIFLSFIMIDR